MLLLLVVNIAGFMWVRLVFADFFALEVTCYNLHG